MHLNRVLKYINYLIAAGLVALLCVVYWFGYRVLPETSGAIAAPVEAPVAIRRDSQGVPHIEARSLEDVCFAQGYAVAQDRLFQLELARRLGAGELAEVI